jgi:hypothetical protein
MGMGGSFDGGEAAEVKLTIDLQLVPRSRKRGSISTSQYVFMVLNYLSTGTTLPRILQYRIYQASVFGISTLKVKKKKQQW